MKTVWRECALFYIILICALLPASLQAKGEDVSSVDIGEDAAVLDSLKLPALTETDCVWDENDLVISETARDLDGNPAVNARGFYRAQYTRDELGNLLTEEYYGLSGEPVDTELGYARAEYTWYTDEEGNSYPVTEDRYAADGSRAEITGSYSYRRDTWDGGTLLSTEYFDAEGNPTRPVGGFAKISYDLKYEGLATLTVTKTYQDEDGALLNGPEGGAKIVSRYVLQYFDENSLPTEKIAQFVEVPGPDTSRGEDAYSVWRLVEEEIFGADGKQVLGADHYYRQLNTYDELGHLLRTDYYDPEGESILHREGYASLVYTYDDLYRVIEKDYLGEDQKLIKSDFGQAKVTYEYYGDSRVKHFERYFGADDNPTMVRNGYSVVEYEYNGPDYDYRYTYYDTVGQYTQGNNGYCRIEFLFADTPEYSWRDTPRLSTAMDQIRQEKYFGTDLELIEIKSGIAGYYNERNENGQVIATHYMNREWEPTRSDEFQYATIRYEYNSPEIDAAPVYESYYDKDDQPCEKKEGYYARAMTYGGPRNELLFEEEYFDAYGHFHQCPQGGI